MTSNEEQSANGQTDDRPDTEPTLLGEVLSLAPRLASRTIAQIQASQQIMSLLSCGGNTALDSDTEDSTAQGHAMAEPVDVLGVIGDDTGDESNDEVEREPSGPAGDAKEATQGARDPSSETAEALAVVAEKADKLEAPDAADLVIPGYDSLAASQVVPRLTTLSLDELSAIGSYEQANRGRRTILNRVKQLLASANGDS